MIRPVLNRFGLGAPSIRFELRTKPSIFFRRLSALVRPERLTKFGEKAGELYGKVAEPKFRLRVGLGLFVHNSFQSIFYGKVILKDGKRYVEGRFSWHPIVRAV